MGAEGTTVEPDCVRLPRSVQWLDLGQSLVFADLFGQYRTLLWTLCSKALWLQLHVPPAGNTSASINFYDNHRRFQILHMISQALKTGKMIMSSLVNSVEMISYTKSPYKKSCALLVCSCVFPSLFAHLINPFTPCTVFCMPSLFDIH